ncbi:hypothetical protein SAMN05428962_4380 [Paenibacillus sp. BC26]|nr:hypothetical protein SAMN05428962_4380 [Paenibacillus sp. BC26]
MNGMDYFKCLIVRHSPYEYRLQNPRSVFQLGAFSCPALVPIT